MVRYRRNLIPGGTWFFTVALADRRSTLLTTSVDSLRTAFRVARAHHPFDVGAIVVLPDHLHAILTLPEGDAAFPLASQSSAATTMPAAAARTGSP